MSLKFSVRFVPLNTKIKNKPTSLRCYVRFNSTRAIFNSGILVEPRYFNQEKQKADVSLRHDGTSVNAEILRIIEFVQRTFDKLTAYPDPAWLKAVCERFVVSGQSADTSLGLLSETRDLPIGIVGYLDKMIHDSRSGARLITKGARSGQRYKPETLKAYNSTKSILQSFCEYKGVMDIPFTHVTHKLYQELSAYFYNELKLSVGYFAVIVKIIKTIMTESRRQGLHSIGAHEIDSFIKPNYESDTVYLNLEQLNKLMGHDFDASGQGHLDNARDLFLVGCWTGLRYSDYSTLRREDIQNEYIRIKAQKTSERISIPLHPMLKKILAKYDGGLPKPISNQKLNKYIKHAARAAGLDHEITVRRNVAGKDVDEHVQFCDMISTHTARRSFATNMFKKGIPTLLIMAITGHKTEVAFLKYIRVTNEEKAAMMAELWNKINWDY